MTKIERNELVPLETLTKICDILKCDLNDILENKRKRKIKFEELKEYSKRYNVN